MTVQRATGSDAQMSGPKSPGWARSAPAETLAAVAFRSGSVLTVLDQLVADPGHGVPVRLLANRLALAAAMATSKAEGRLAQETDIRDAYHLAPAGGARGPDGDLLAFWRDVAGLRLGGRDWHREVQDLMGPAFADHTLPWTQTAVAHARTHGPLAGCVWAMRAVLERDDRAERCAFMLSDVVLAQALNWRRALPLSARGLTKGMLRALTTENPEADLAVQSRLLMSLNDAVRLSRDLAGRAAALQAVARKLRAKGSEAAVALFLTEDAVAPSTMLSPIIQGSTTPMTDRAARRFCDRLVALGVAHELTGRATFRLYGIAR